MNTGETAINRIRIEVPQSSARPVAPARPAAHAPGIEEAAEGQAPEAAVTIEAIDPAQVEVEVEKVNLWYGAKQALFDINLTFAKNKVTALIGPSGCGKSTLLRCFNRMNDLVDICRMEGTIRVGGRDIRDPALDATELRKNVGMVFQKPNPFPKTIYENVAYGPRIQGVRGREKLDVIVERSIRQAALWDEVKDRLNDSALGLSGGQQQRLCIARAVAVEPEVLLMDEPCSALDPISTGRIEDLMIDLKEKYTILIVTHNMQQAARVSDYTAYMLMGEMIEYRETKELFSRPRDKRTEDYITGRFG